MKRIVDTLEELEEGLRSHYTERDGKFYLDVDEEEDTRDSSKLKSALQKERQALAAAKKAMAELKARFGDLDPEAARDAMKTIGELEEKNLLGEGKFEEAVKKRTERIVSQYEAKLKDITGENGGLKSQLEELLIDNAIRAAAVKGRIVPGAIEDAVLLGKTVFRLQDGQPVPMKGDEVLYGKTPNKPLTMEEWIAERADDRPHWFGQNAGGGSIGSGDSANGHSISREEARNPKTYRTAFEAAQKAGQSLTIRD